MLEAADLVRLGNAAIVAPAGHGKTELIVNIAALGKRALVLTHTHAGVHAIRSRLKRLGVSHNTVAVDTIAGWSMRYAYAFPGVAQPPKGVPEGAQWEKIYEGAKAALSVSAVRQVVEASYDRILIDEYQDCNPLQHELAIALSGIVPTLIFGDPMQGIFEFAGANLSWDRVIHRKFPLVGTLEIPYRWREKNSALGEWIAEVRQKLILGATIDLTVAPVEFRPAANAFEMGAFFDGLDEKEGTFAAIHCRKGLCYQLASAAGGGYQAIEEVAARRLKEFGVAWDKSLERQSRIDAINILLKDCFRKKDLAIGEVDTPEDIGVKASMNAAAKRLGNIDGAEAALELIILARKRSRWKLFRSELWRDAERALSELSSGRSETLLDATERIRQRTSITGRKLPKRTVSTPLLLKGLEFDHVVIPDATHFVNEDSAEAKLFYVAISRATRSLTISASARSIVFPIPEI